jgi:SAM-dependent methyltransferase
VHDTPNNSCCRASRPAALKVGDTVVVADFEPILEEPPLTAPCEKDVAVKPLINDATTLLRAAERALAKLGPTDQVGVAAADEETAEPFLQAARRLGFDAAILPLADHPSAWAEALATLPRARLLILAGYCVGVYECFRAVSTLATQRNITVLRPAYDYNPVLEDPVFDGICRRLSSCTPWDLGFWRSQKSYGVFQLLVEAAALPGDFVEFGCYKGYSAAFAAETLRALGATSRRIHLFDTWQGMPPQPGDRDNYYEGGDFADTSLSAVRKVHAPWADMFEYVQGDIVKTVARAANVPLAYIRIDVDLYHPTVAILEHAFPRLAPGGLVYLDDYVPCETAGERLAVDEFLSNRPERVQMIYGNRSFIRKSGR